MMTVQNVYLALILMAVISSQLEIATEVLWEDTV
jgi:hypothetical protein